MLDGSLRQPERSEFAPSEAAAPLLLVYQMGKVASWSWMALGRQHFGVGEAAHVHYLAPASLSFLRRQYEASGPGQTLLRRMPLRAMLHSSERARALITGSHGAERPVVLVTGIREPVARSISLLFFLADFAGYSRGGLSWRDGASLQDVERAFIAIWERILGEDWPEDTFGSLAQFVIGIYRSWFDRELAAVLGIDVARAEFPPGPARRLFAQGAARVLVYRVEDMLPGSPGYVLLRADLEALSGQACPAFPTQNVAASRRAGEFYRAFQARLRMPARLLDRIYGQPAVERFYSPAEIARFRRRWSDGPVA